MKHLFIMRFFLLLLCSTALNVASDLASAQSSEEERIKHLIVMVSGQLGGEETFGAGIIFGLGPNRLYIVTANHVVRRGQVEVENLSVEFRALPGEPIPVTLLRHHDRELDIAVMRVVDVESIGLPIDTVPFDRLMNMSTSPYAVLASARSC
jgi:S1-C subfamily serine protease